IIFLPRCLTAGSQRFSCHFIGKSYHLTTKYSSGFLRRASTCPSADLHILIEHLQDFPVIRPLLCHLIGAVLAHADAVPEAAAADDKGVTALLYSKEGAGQQ